MKKQLDPFIILFTAMLVLIVGKQAKSESTGLNQTKNSVFFTYADNHLFIFPDTAKNVRKPSATIQNKDKGVGPVKDVQLGPINQKMVSEGKSIFNSKCFLCHELDQKKIGPPLRNVAKERTPEYIMNMIINPTKMEKEDPFVKDLLRKSNNVPMTEQSVTQDQARSLLEYLRTVVK